MKSGIDEALSVDKKQMKLIKKLITYNRKSKWFNKAEEFLEVIESHHCSAFFKSPVPKDFQEFHAKIKVTQPHFLKGVVKTWGVMFRIN